MSGLRQRVSMDASLALFAAVVLGFVGWVLVRDVEPDGPGRSRAAVDQVAPDQESELPTPSTELSPGPADDSLTVLVLGDETVRGTRPAGRWVSGLGDDGATTVVNRSRPQSGYVTDGPGGECGLPRCPDLLEMLRWVVDEESPPPAPDVVLVSAGAYDVAAPERRLRRGTAAFFDELGSSYPDAAVVVLSPIVRTPRVPDGLEGVRDVVVAEATRARATVLDVGQPYADAAGPTDDERTAQAGDVLLAAVEDVLADL